MQAGMLVKMATRAGLLCGTLFFSVGLAHAEDDMILLDRDGLVLRAHLQAGLNVVSEHNLFWNYADTFAPSAGFNANPTWLEGYVKPGLSFSKEITSVVSAYGLISMVASGTAGIDAYSTGNTGRITLEEGYLGLRSSCRSMGRPPRRAAIWLQRINPRADAADIGKLAFQDHASPSRAQ